MEWTGYLVTGFFATWLGISLWQMWRKRRWARIEADAAITLAALTAEPEPPHMPKMIYVCNNGPGKIMHINNTVPDIAAFNTDLQQSIQAGGVSCGKAGGQRTFYPWHSVIKVEYQP